MIQTIRNNGVYIKIAGFFNRHPVIKEYTEAFFYAFIIAMFVRTFIIQAFKIPTGSMEPTLHGADRGGDRILVNKFLYFFKEPDRGDIIVFSTKGIKGLDGKDYIKRLVGLPGDTVEIKDGHLYVNGKMLVYPEKFRTNYYYNFDGYPEEGYGSRGQALKVPAKSYYALGDNSINSKDSRYWGFVPKRNVKGKALFIYWPIWRIGTLH